MFWYELIKPVMEIELGGQILNSLHDNLKYWPFFKKINKKLKK